MKNFLVAMALLTATAALPAWAADATFERDLSVNGKPDLTVQTGSGSIHLVRGTGNRIHVIGALVLGSGRGAGSPHRLNAAD
jgi:hypothetical protein